MSETNFSVHARAVAESFWGEPDPRKSTAKELRWGDKGSKVLDLEKGAWFDFEAVEGGGVIDLVMRENGCDKAGAIAWLEQEGFIEGREQRRQDPPRQRQEEPEKDGGKRVIVQAFDYTTGDGELIYQTCRVEWRLGDGSWRLNKAGKTAKSFLQRRPAGDGSWLYNLDGVSPTLFRLQQLQLAIEAGKTVLVVEGERKVLTAEALGFAATCNSGGAGKLDDGLLAHFKGAHVVIIPDNDDAGSNHAEVVAGKLRGIAGSIRVLALPNLGPKEDLVDWHAAGGTREQLMKLIEDLQLHRRQAPKSHFGGRTLQDLAGSRLVYDWLIKGLIERGAVFIVAGEKSSGKSFFAVGMGMSVARGVDYEFAGPRQVKRGLVIYMATEDGKGVQLRAEGYRRDNGIPADEKIPFVIMDRNFSLMDDEAIDKFIAECRDWAAFYETKLEMVMIDTFSRATEGLDEIQSGEVGRVLGRVNRIAVELDCAVCLVHHMNAKGDRVRGHSSLGNNVSQVIEIRQMMKFQTNRNAPPEKLTDGNRRVKRQALLEKNKNGQDDIKEQFVLRRVAMGKDEDGYEVSTCVLEKPAEGGGEQTQSRSPSLTHEQRVFMDALRAAIEDEGIDMPAGVRVGSSVRRAVKRTAFVARLKKVWAFRHPPEEGEAQRKEIADAMKRLSEQLSNNSYIGRDNDKDILWDLGKTGRPPRDPQPSASTADIEAPF